MVFTLAVQQLLRPIYRFRLEVRRLSLARLYIFVFCAVVFIIIAAILPNFPMLHGGPWGYPIIWEIGGAFLFAGAYGAVVLAVVGPVRLRPERIAEFARRAANLLSSADDQDHIDFVKDLGRNLPTLIKAASFIESLRTPWKSRTSAFYDFLHRVEIERASYAYSLLRIVADPNFCATLVKRSPWEVVYMLREISRKQLYTQAAEQFIRELARQAILLDDAMMAREVGYHGFGTAPLLSENLFSDKYIIEHYDPFGAFQFYVDEELSPSIIDRFNISVELYYKTLVENKMIYRSQSSFSILEFYKNIYMLVRKYRENNENDHKFIMLFHNSITIAIKMAKAFLNSMESEEYKEFYVIDEKNYHSDALEILVEIVYEALASISNGFKGFDDPYWIAAQGAVAKAFPSIGAEPSGMTPFQQRLALKLIGKLKHNMDGFYPAICRVLLACVGPYRQPAEQTNRTAFNILKDAMYFELKKLPRLALSKPDKLTDYFPDNVRYDVKKTSLVHSYLMGEQAVTKLSALNIQPISLIAEDIRRRVDFDPGDVVDASN